MMSTKVLSNNVQLNDRVLWFDGDSSFPHNNVPSVMAQGINVKFTDVITNDIRQYNQFSDSEEQITIKTGIHDLDLSLTIPAEYKNIDVWEYIHSKTIEYLSNVNLTTQEQKSRVKRILYEIDLYKKFNLEDFLKSIVYIINTLHTKKIIWGVGRGSSVSSYILFILGVHDIDSVYFDLDINEFLHD